MHKSAYSINKPLVIGFILKETLKMYLFEDLINPLPFWIALLVIKPFPPQCYAEANVFQVLTVFIVL